MQVKDEQFCSPLPPYKDPETGATVYLGAVCDNFLTANQLILDESAWQKLQESWRTTGQSTECTNSNTIGDIKGELEKLCSRTRCSYKMLSAIRTGNRSLSKVMNLGVTAAKLSTQYITERNLNVRR